jgi:hypothetical protein
MSGSQNQWKTDAIWDNKSGPRLMKDISGSKLDKYSLFWVFRSDENIGQFSNEALLSKNAIKIDSLQCAGYNLPSLKY